MKTWQTALILGCAAGSGADGGAYFAFSTFVMRGLEATPLAQRIVTMQQINLAAVNPWFAVMLFGTGIATLVLLTPAWKQRNVALLLACGLYLASLVITFGCNVPLNDQLAALDTQPLGANAAWQRFLAPWMLWNDLRTITALISTACFAAAFLTPSGKETR